MLTADPLSGNAPVVTINGNDATDFDSFANLTPTDLLGALQAFGSSLTGLASSKLLAKQIPLTNVTVGQAADFGAEFAKDVTGLLGSSTGTPDFANIQQFAQDLGALAGITDVTTSYASSGDELDIGFTLAETFATTPATFDYNLSGAAGSVLGDLSGVAAASASLSISGSGSVSVGLAFNLTPSNVQVQAATALPPNGVLPADAHFSLSLSTQGAAPTVVPVTVGAAATQGNSLAAGLLGDVNAALQQALEAAGLDGSLVTATTSDIDGGQGLVLTLAAGALTALSVAAVPTDPAVYELGLAPPQTPSAALTGTAALPANGRLTADTGFTVTADGGSATPITITAAATSGNGDPADLLAQMKTALAPVNTALQAAGRTPVAVSLNSAGELAFTITGYGSTLRIEAEAGNALGLPAAQSIEAGAPVVSVEASAAAVPSSFVLTQDQTFAISVDGGTAYQVTVTAAYTAANTTGQQLADEVTTALKPVNDALASAGLPDLLVQIDSNGRLLFSTTGSSSGLVIQAAAGNQLGIGSDDISAAATLTVVGSASCADQVSVTELSVGGTLDLSGSLTADATFGIVSINLGPANVALDASISLGLNQPVVLNDLLANPGDIASFFHPDRHWPDQGR